ncbi:MAG TPA: energy transducer TonB [Sphingomonadaceae bacterium]|nr:energy transducer TonB [Sphingomonadaceae bacterium]
MHAAYRRSSGRDDAKALYRARVPGAAFVPQHDPTPIPYTVYGAGRRPNWAAILAILAGHALLLATLIRADVITIKKPAPAPLVVDLISVAPPPQPEAPPEPVVPVKTVRAAVVVPAPVVVTPAAAPPPIAVSTTPPPPHPVAVVAPPAPKTVTASDLSTTMLFAKPPRYPIESRRKHEQGVVTLSLVLGLDGRVAQISLARSSGFERLDKAALDAVRYWRWSPTVRNGQPVTVRGFVEIPFVLK